MIPGFLYPEITKVSDRAKLIYPSTAGDFNFMAVKEICYRLADRPGRYRFTAALSQQYLYVMRLAEMFT